MITIQEQTFTYDDFDKGRVFEYLSSIEDPYEQAMEERRLAVVANEVNFKYFRRLFGKYQEKLRKIQKPVFTEDRLSEFEAQPFELTKGEWTADEGGVWR